MSVPKNIHWHFYRLDEVRIKPLFQLLTRSGCSNTNSVANSPDLVIIPQLGQIWKRFIFFPNNNFEIEFIWWDLTKTYV